jgi:hypothetical protein
MLLWCSSGMGFLKISFPPTYIPNSSKFPAIRPAVPPLPHSVPEALHVSHVLFPRNRSPRPSLTISMALLPGVPVRIRMASSSALLSVCSPYLSNFSRGRSSSDHSRMGRGYFLAFFFICKKGGIGNHLSLSWQNDQIYV